MEIRSIPLSMELKSFVRDNRSWSAKAGEKDDLIASSLLSIRIIDEIQNWDSKVYDRLAEIIETDDLNEAPLPFIIA